MAGANPDWGEIATTTLHSRSRRLADNVTRNNALLARLSKRGRISPVDGGEAIVEALEYAENATYRRYSAYDALEVGPSDVLSAALYPWAQIAVAVSIAGIEELQNAGAERMIPLLDERIGNAERTMTNGLSSDLYSDGSADGGRQIGGLQLLVPDSGLGIAGGIDRGRWPFWRSAVGSFAAAGFAPGSATILTMMDRQWLAQVRGRDRPDLILADHNYYEFYWQAQRAIQRVTDEGRARAGYASLTFMDAEVVRDDAFYAWQWAENPRRYMYFLNSRYLRLRPHRQRDMAVLAPDRFAANQDALVRLIAWAGNLTMSNAFLQGVLLD